MSISKTISPILNTSFAPGATEGLRPSDQVNNYLYKKILSTKQGRRLPSIRQMVSECSVSVATVQSAVSRFCSEGYIESRDRSGLYRSDRPLGMADLAAHIEVCFINPNGNLEISPGPFYETMLMDLSLHAGRDLRGLRVHQWESEQAALAALAALIHRDDFRACIVMGPGNSRLVTFLLEHGIVTVSMYSSGTDFAPQCVVFDAEEAVRTQLRHLMDLGHRRIGYLHAVEDRHYHSDLLRMRETFYRLAVEADFTVKPYWVQFGGFTDNQAAQGVEALLGGPERPTAVVCFDHHLPAVYRRAQQLGLTIPQDLSVIGLNDLPVSSAVYPAATTVRNPRIKGIQRAMELINRQLLGQNEPGQTCITIEPELVQRGSTAPPNTSTNK